jgi:hypothetical protein
MNAIVSQSKKLNKKGVCCALLEFIEPAKGGAKTAPLDGERSRAQGDASARTGKSPDRTF